MTRTPFEALVVDFGGVLTTPLQEAMIAFAADIGIELQDLIRIALGAYSVGNDQLVVDFETGKISEDDFAVKFAARIKKVSGVEVAPEGLVRRIFKGLNIEEDMLFGLEATRSGGYKTAMLSNSWGMSLYPRPHRSPLRRDGDLRRGWDAEARSRDIRRYRGETRGPRREVHLR